MKSIIKKVSLIFLLIILNIILFYNIFKKNNNNIIKLSDNYVDASFTSNNYLNNINNIKNDVEKYKLSKLNISKENEFLDKEDDTNTITPPFIEHFSNESNTKNNIKNNNKNVNTQPPKFMKKIDKILFINLHHRKDRLKQITNEFKKMDLPENKIERISAVREKYNGHIGCCKSHIKAMDEIIKNKYKYTMVFEDDFVFTTNKNVLDEKISAFLSHYKDDWDMIQLASVYTNLKDSNIDYIKDVNSASTSSAYIINLEFATILRDDLKESLRLMEIDMKEYIKKNNNIPKKKFETKYALDQRWYGLQKKSRWYLFKPNIGKQGGEAVKSSIMSKNIEGFVSHSNYKVKLYSLMC